MTAERTVTIDQAIPTWQLVLALAWPALLQHLLLLSVSLSDRYLAGHYQPPAGVSANASLAALTTSAYLGWFLSSYLVLVGTGSTALVARFVGAGERRLAIHTTGQAVILALCVGTLGMIVGLISRRALVDLLQLRGDAAELAADYLVPLLAVLPLQAIATAGTACLAGAGDTRTGLVVMGGTAILNVPLSWGLCFGLGPLPQLGFVGIAVGTALAHALAGVVVIGLLARGWSGLRCHVRDLWPDLRLLGRLLAVSVPAALDSLSVVAGQAWFLGIVNGLGEVASSAHGVAIGWEALGYLSGMAFATAAMTLVGQNLGANRPGAAAHAGWVAFGMGAVTMTVMGSIFYTFAPAMFALFNPAPEQQPVIETGVPVLRLVAFAMPALASCIVFTGALRGAGDARVPVLFTWTGFLLIRIPLAYLLTGEGITLGPLGMVPGAGLGLYGAWLAMLADLWLRGVLFFLRFASGRWQRARV